MKTATIEEAKERLEELIAAARAGERVEITDEGETVASLLGAAAGTNGPGVTREQTVQRLEADGLLKHNPRMPSLRALEESGLSEAAIGLLRALLDEREESQ